MEGSDGAVNNIERRIVEMVFDNAQFERGISQSQRSLQVFERSIDSLKGISTRAFELSSSPVKVALQEVEHGLSAFQVASMRIVSNITDTIYGKLSGVINTVSNKVVQGGISRAMNIENAHFMLQGLIDDEQQVKDIMDDAKDSVDGTAYSYDSAAKAAAQFAATGMRAGDEMQTALKGITGIAATTNSSYEDISRIFTTVAGNGRLMGDQLLQMSSRGLNVAASLSKYFQDVSNGSVKASDEVSKSVKKLVKKYGSNEAAIRDMVSKGKISFDIFSEAMGTTFGDHAKKANETFNGALSNIGAALARTGEMFVAPLIEQNGVLVKLFNAIREKVNEINKALKPIATIVTDKIKIVIDGIASSIEGLNLNRIIERISRIWDIIKIIFSGVKNLTSGLMTVISPIITAFKDFWFSLGYGNNTLKSLATRFEEWTKNVRLTTEQQEKLYEISKKLFRSIKSFIEKAYPIVKKVLSYIITGVKDAIGVIVVVTTSIKDLVQAIKNSDGTFSGAMNSIKQWMKGLKNTEKQLEKTQDNIADKTEKTNNRISNALKKTTIGEAISNIGDKFKEKIKPVADLFVKAYEYIADKVSKIFNVIKTTTKAFFDTLFPKKSSENIKKANEQLEKTEKKLTLLQKIAMAIGKFDIRKIPEYISNIHKGILKVASGFNEFVKSVGYKDIRSFIEDGLFLVFGIQINRTVGSVNKTIKNFGNIFKDPSEGIRKFLEEWGKVGTSASKNMDGVSNSLKKLLETLSKRNSKIRIDPSAILTFAAAIAILTVSLYALSKIDVQGLLTTFGVLSGILWQIVLAVKYLSAVGEVQVVKFWEKVIPQNTNTFGILIGLASALMMVAVSIRILSGADMAKVSQAFVILSAALWEFVGIIAVLQKIDFSKDSGRMVRAFKTLSKVMLSLSISLALLSLADTKKVAYALGMLSVALWEFVGVFAVMQKIDFKASSGFMVLSFKSLAKALGIVALSLALLSLCDPDKTSLSLLLLSSMMWQMLAVMMAIKANEMGPMMLVVSQAFIIMSISLGIISGALKKLAKIDYGHLLVSFGVLSLSLMTLIGALKYLNDNKTNGLQGAIAMVLLAGVFVQMAESFKKLGELDIKNMIVATLSIAGLLAAMVIVIKKLDGLPKEANGVAAITAIAGSLMMFAMALQVVGKMSLGDMIKSLVGLGVILVGLAFGGQYLAAAAPGLLSFAGALLVLGIAIGVLGAGLFALGAGLVSFGAGLMTSISGIIANAYGMSELIRILIKSFIDGINGSAEIIKTFIISQIQMFCDVILGTSSILVDTSLKLLLTILKGLVDYGPMITDYLLEFLLIVINKLADRAPELTSGIIRLLNGIWKGLKEALGNETSIFQIIASLTGLTLILTILGAIPGAKYMALQGLAVMAIVLAGIMSLMITFGVISSLPGVKWLIHKGGDLLEELGAALGRFIGGLVGGIGAGMSSQLPKICENVQKGLDALNLDKDTVDGIKNLAEAMLLISADNLLESITRLFTKKNSFEEFGKAIESFGPHFTNFYESIKTIDDTDKVEKVCEAIKILCEAAKQIPDSGESLKSFFFGDHDISEFGRKLVSFGPHLVEFCDIVRNIDTTGVKPASEALTTLCIAAKQIPDRGESLKSFFFGDHDISEFGRKLESFGPHFRDFCDTVAGIDTSGAEPTAEALSKMAIAAKNLDPEGGWIQKLIGNGNLSMFGDQLLNFAPKFKLFLEGISGVGSDDAESAVTCIETMAKVAYHLKDAYGYFDKLNFGSVDTYGRAIGIYNSPLVILGKQLEAFGPPFSNFVSSIGTVSSSSIDSVASVTEKFGKIAAQLSTISLDMTSMNLGILGDYLYSLGNSIVSFASVISEINSESIDLALDTLNELIKMAKDIVGVNYENFDQFVEKMASIGTRGVSEIISALTDSKVSVPDAIEEAVDEYVVKIEEQIDRVNNIITTNVRSGLAQWTFKNIAKQNVLGGLEIGLKDSTGINNIKIASTKAGEAAATGMKSKVSKSSGRNIGVDFINGLIIGLNGVNGRSALGRAASSAGNIILTYIRNRLDSHSPSREAIKIGGDVDNGLAIGMDRFSGVIRESAKNVGNETLNSMRDSIDRLNDSLFDDNFRPVISPILDLSDVESRAGDVNGLFSDKQFKMAADINGMMNSYAEANRLAKSLTLDDGRMVEAITGLRRDVNAMGMQMSNLQVVMDSGALVGQIAKPMDSALGNMALRNWREREA